MAMQCWTLKSDRINFPLNLPVHLNFSVWLSLIWIREVIQKTLHDCEKLPWTHHTDVKVWSWLFLLKYVTLTTTVTITTITIWVFEFCHNLIFWVLSQFEFLSFVKIWFFYFCHIFSFFLFCHNLSFLVLSQFEFLNFVAIIFFLV